MGMETPRSSRRERKKSKMLEKKGYLSLRVSSADDPLWKNLDASSGDMSRSFLHDEPRTSLFGSKAKKIETSARAKRQSTLGGKKKKRYHPVADEDLLGRSSAQLESKVKKGKKKVRKK